MNDLSEALEILEWGAARTDGTSAALSPEQCQAVWAALRRLAVFEMDLVEEITGQTSTDPEGTPI